MFTLTTYPTYILLHKHTRHTRYRHISTTNKTVFDIDRHFGKLACVRELLREFEWVFFLDLDAIVVDFSRRLEDVLPPDRIDADVTFVGDSNIINSGVMLYRRSNWTDRFLDEALRMGRQDPEWNTKHMIGMGGENAALAIVLGGCIASQSHDALRACYRQVDLGPSFRSVLFGGKQKEAFAAARLSSDVSKHVAMLAHTEWQS